MQTTHRIISRDVISRVNQGFIEQRRVDMSQLPNRVSESIRSTTFSREQLTQAFANARKRISDAA